MAKTLTKDEYKKYPFPISVLIFYVILTAVTFILLELLQAWIFAYNFSNMDKQLGGYAIMAVGGIALWFFECVVLYPRIRNFKIYRAIGLFRFLKICAVLCPIILIASIAYLIFVKQDFLFFDVIVIFFKCAIPFFLSRKVRDELSYSLCSNCGLLHTTRSIDCQKTDLGTKHKFHNEGGYTNSWKTSVGILFQDVPKTAVYDGEFQRTNYKTTYQCSVCGYTYTNDYTYETRID